MHGNILPIVYCSCKKYVFTKESIDACGFQIPFGFYFFFLLQNVICFFGGSHKHHMISHGQ